MADPWMNVHFGALYFLFSFKFPLWPGLFLFPLFLHSMTSSLPPPILSASEMKALSVWKHVAYAISSLVDGCVHSCWYMPFFFPNAGLQIIRYLKTSYCLIVYYKYQGLLLTSFGSLCFWSCLNHFTDANGSLLKDLMLICKIL